MQKRNVKANRLMFLMSVWVFTTYVIGNLSYSLFYSLTTILKFDNNEFFKILRVVTIHLLFLAHGTEIFQFYFFDKTYRKNFIDKIQTVKKFFLRFKCGQN